MVIMTKLIICMLLALVNTTNCYKLSIEGKIPVETVYHQANCGPYSNKLTYGWNWGYKFSKVKEECPKNMYILDLYDPMQTNMLRGNFREYDLICCKKSVKEVIENMTVTTSTTVIRPKLRFVENI